MIYERNIRLGQRAFWLFGACVAAFIAAVVAIMVYAVGCAYMDSRRPRHCAQYATAYYRVGDVMLPGQVCARWHYDDTGEER